MLYYGFRQICSLEKRNMYKYALLAEKVIIKDLITKCFSGISKYVLLDIIENEFLKDLY